MANALRGEVPLPGTEYVLRYDVNALCEVEDATKDNILEVISKLQDGKPSFKIIRLLLWAGLRSGTPGITVEEAGRIMQDAGIQNTAEAIGEAFTASFVPPGADTPAKN